MFNLSFASKHNYSNAQAGVEVPVELHFGGEEVRFLAKVDTGASFCIFQREYAEAVGIVVEEGYRQIVATATSQFVTFGHEVDLFCIGLRSTATVYFAEQRNFSRNVLGRAGWLNQYRFGLVDHDSDLYLSAHSDPI